MEILENVPIKLGKFFVPVDFIFLDMEEDKHIPIILGRQLLATSSRCEEDEEEFKLNINEMPPVVNMVCQVDIVDGHLKQPPMVQMKDVGGMNEASINKGPNKLKEVPLLTTKPCPPKPPPKDPKDVPKEEEKEESKEKYQRQGA